MNQTTLLLSKENFKFSSGHFLIFDDQRAERLHGHNYQVKVEITIPPEKNLMDQGYFVDFNVFKKYIKDRLDQWDEFVLLPKNHKDMKFREEGPSLHINFRDRYYVLPKNEVVLLPVINTSVEQLSRILAEDFYQAFKLYKVTKVLVSVEETKGQAAATVAGDF
ncbi:MAG: 6-carboxytetrahydropterin synthase [Bdellovibrionota bacterium]